MESLAEGKLQTNVHTTADGRVVIEHSEGSVVLPADQIPTIIHQLHVCYDYCAAWKEQGKD